jgi:excinuclease ABC subunit B
MREAAADLNFEEAARLRDEVKRLRATEMAVVDDPTTKQRVVQTRAGAYAGTKKYGDAANLPVSAMKKRGVQAAIKASGGAASSSPSRSGAASAPSPRSSRGEGRGEGQPASGASRSKVHKPHLDEMHGPESLPFREKPTLPTKPFGSSSRIIQPTNSRESGPEFGPSPRSTGGAPGRRGGWKKR